MFDYYISILNFVVVIFAGLALIGAFCSVGWMISDRELKKERFSNSLLHSKVKSQANEIETLRAKNNFLSNRVVEEYESIKRTTADVERLATENAELSERLHNLLDSICQQIDSDDENAENSAPWEDLDAGCGQPDMEITEA